MRGGSKMNIYNLIDQLHTINPESILYCYPADDDDAQILTDEFPQIRIVQTLGWWVPHGTRISMSEALQKEFDVVCLPGEVIEDMLGAGIKCLKSKGYIYSDLEIVTKGTGVKKGEYYDGIYRYKKK